MQGQCRCGSVDTLFRVRGIGLCGACYEKEKLQADDERGIALRKAEQIKLKRRLNAGFTAYENVMDILRGIRGDLA